MNAATINKDMLPTDTAALHALVRELLGKLKISDLRADRAEYKLRDLIRRLRISRMSVQSFTSCRSNISGDAGPRFHGMPVQDDAGRRTVSESLPCVNSLLNVSSAVAASGFDRR
jgi:hypothetical protein